MWLMLIDSHIYAQHAHTCISPMTRLLSRRSRRASALTYSPSASCVMVTLPFSTSEMTPSGVPAWFRLRRCSACTHACGVRHGQHEDCVHVYTIGRAQIAVCAHDAHHAHALHAPMPIQNPSSITSHHALPRSQTIACLHYSVRPSRHARIHNRRDCLWKTPCPPAEQRPSAHLALRKRTHDARALAEQGFVHLAELPVTGADELV